MGGSYLSSGLAKCRLLAHLMLCRDILKGNKQTDLKVKELFGMEAISEALPQVIHGSWV